MYEKLLSQVPLFQALSHRELAWLDIACRERDYAAGDALVRKGDGIGVGLFIVTSGSVRFDQCQEIVDDECEIKEFGVGAILGENALLEDAPSEVTITAAEPTHVVTIPIWDFRETMREYPDLAIHLLAFLGQRLRAQADVSGRGNRNGERGWLPDI